MESNQDSGQIPPKMEEQQAQLDVTSLSLAKGRKKRAHLQEIKGFYMVYDSQYKEDKTVMNVHCTQLRLILMSHWDRHKRLNKMFHLHNSFAINKTSDKYQCKIDTQKRSCMLKDHQISPNYKMNVYKGSLKTSIHSKLAKNINVF
ncbi:hypothetical protein DUI87_16205 [Hirundo rustica rustica]|uniref:Uncharacterized protein n=1 Tax=Hirundo rustica rustica TaxID=333673 RepID=A0A3M0K0H9_HIRRU|nr:hypothetical protein DUI87_16205 [Hirundo rustica rustica]